LIVVEKRRYARRDMPDFLDYTVENEIAFLTVNNPPVNAMSPGVPEAIVEGVARAEADEGARAIVLIGGGRTFIAGADIKEFAKITSGEKDRGGDLFPVIDALEDASKPTIAAIHGTALGGGLEIAQGCHYRVALASAQVGQPEVKLGIIPGAAGTQRLPRLAGVALATEMCALGNPVRAQAAHTAGILDRIVEGSTPDDLRAGALAFAQEVAEKGGSHPKTRDRNEKLGDEESNAAVFAAARETAAKKRRGYEAPLAAIEAVEAATKLPFAAGLKREQEIFLRCLYSDQSKAMIHAFFGEREVRKIPGVPKDTPVREIRQAAVVGAGTMGGGIAMNYVNAGIPVLLKETTPEALERGLAMIAKNYQRSIARGRFSEEWVEERLALITPTLSYAGFQEADVITEAVFEGMELKKKVFAELDEVAKPGAILASNTSTLSIDEIASATRRPQDVIGHHFFSPANVMRLMEIVRGGETAKDVIATSMGLAKRLRKVGVLAGNCFGFIGNRMFGPYRREAIFLVEEGAGIAQVDRVLYEFGMAMGPMAVGDLAGLDVGWRIRKEHPEHFPEGVRYPLSEDKLCEMGRYGQKTGGGWYSYDEKRRPSEDPEVLKVVADTAAEAGIEQREVDDAEILDRCLYALVNEGAHLLGEGFALRAGDIDVVYMNGYGFPAYRGGPMWFADTVGLPRVLERVKEFAARHGEGWKPAPLLEELAAAGSTFAAWDRGRAQKVGA